MSKVVKLNDFEILEEDKDYIIVDDNIAEIICILNKKGYKTLFSCEGHTKPEQIVSKSHISKYDELKKTFSNLKVIEKNKEEFSYVLTILKEYIYILFDKNYDFKTLPESFDTFESEGRFGIEKQVNNEEEKKKYLDILLKWSKQI